MVKRVRITNESLNSYGTRVLTAGIDTTQYERNPVLLYMHERGKVIGTVANLQRKDDELSGELVFDEASELSRQCKEQWEKGSLRMVSAGLNILELSNAPEYLVPGQTRATIIRSKLYEVSLVDIGANDDAIALYKDGRMINLGKGGECHLPLINNPNNKQDMELKTIALTLGLADTATEADVMAELGKLNAAKQEIAQLKAEKESLQLAQITAQVETAIKEQRFGEDKKEHFINLGKQIGSEALKATLDAIQPRVKLSAVILGGGGGNQWKKLSDVPEAERITLRQDNPSEYKRLYKAEYGFDCKLEN